MEKYKVVFHLDEGVKARADMVLINISNLIADLGEDNVTIELVANSEGVTAFLKEPNWHISKIEGLMAKGVRFVVCANSLRQAGLTKDSLMAQIEVVPAGVSELVKKQAEGWAYIRP
ncbi:MAG: DsrE family protein [Bacteroidetes bacterium]|nr:DsrE family protein [Bacteroidota bacterium]